VLKYDIALCNGAEAIETMLANYGGGSSTGGTGCEFDTCRRRHVFL
jgi:hypothetical protein